MTDHSPGTTYSDTGKLYSLHRRRRRRLLMALALGLLLAALLLPLLEGWRPNFYQPARPALTQAKMHLSAFYVDEKFLLTELSETHRQLAATLDLLDKAKQQLAPADRSLLERLRARLRQLEDDRMTRRLTPDALHKLYKQLASELEELIHRSE
jgi:hypothetical protein